MRSVKMTARLAIILLLVTAAGCARPDWIEQTLVTVDVTGVWRGGFVTSQGGGAMELTLQQSGPKVNGQVTFSPAYAFNGRIEGTVSGDVLRLRGERTGMTGELQVNGDEMTGRGTTAAGPGTMTLRRQQ